MTKKLIQVHLNGGQSVYEVCVFINRVNLKMTYQTVLNEKVIFEGAEFWAARDAMVDGVSKTQKLLQQAH